MTAKHHLDYVDIVLFLVIVVHVLYELGNKILDQVNPFKWVIALRDIPHLSESIQKLIKDCFVLGQPLLRLYSIILAKEVGIDAEAQVAALTNDVVKVLTRVKVGGKRMGIRLI